MVNILYQCYLHICLLTTARNAILLDYIDNNDDKCNTL